MKTASIAALLLAAGCGGTSASGDCTIQLGGAASGTIACSRVAAEFNGTSGVGGFAVSASSGSAQFDLAISVDGQPSAGQAVPAGGSVAITASGKTWQLAVPAAASAFSLEISDLGGGTDIAGNIGWPSVHGTLTATLQPQGSATGTVTVQASF